jgi:flagellar L-ring protein precursor FlgH
MHWAIPAECPSWRRGNLLRRALRWWLILSLAAKLLIIAGAAFSAARAHGQDSSLFHHDLPVKGQDALRLSSSSWLFQKSDPPAQVRMHDLITIVVDEKSAVTSTGQLNRQKTGKFDAELKDWIHFAPGWSMKPSPMSNGQPKANGTLDSQYQAQADLETKDALSFKISAEIVDVRPNGNLVVEAHHRIQVNEDIWVASLRGVVRREDVLPNNTVLSQNIAELEIEKKEVGNVRDGYRRGWLVRLYDRFSIF